MSKGRAHLEKGILDFAVGYELIAPEILDEIAICRAGAAPGHVDGFGEASNLLRVLWRVGTYRKPADGTGGK